MTPRRSPDPPWAQPPAAGQLDQRVRLLAQDTATVRVQFHNHRTTTLDLSWAAGSHRVPVPKEVNAARVHRVDAGTGDVSLVCE
jgi:hypothetical protein